MVTPPITNTLTSVTPTEPPKKGNYSGGSITQDGCGVVLGDQSNTLCEAPWLGTRIRLVPVYRTAKIRCYGKVKPKCSQRKEAYHKETDSCKFLRKYDFLSRFYSVLNNVSHLG